MTMQYTRATTQEPQVTVAITLPDGTILERSTRLETLGNPRYWMTDASAALEEIWGGLRQMGAAVYGEPPKR